MASPFSLSGKKKDKAGGGDYNALLKKNMARYKDRDEAVRKTNIASGYGNSTAQRHMHDKPAAKAAAPAGKAAPASTDRRKTSSTKRKSNFSLPSSAPIPAARPTRSPTSEPNSLMPSPPPGIGSGIPTPPMPSFSPDLAVSPPRPPDPMGAGAPQGMGMSGIGYVPPVPSAPPVSPQFPQDNNMMQTAPQNGLHIGTTRPPPPPAFSDPLMGEGRPQGMYGQPSIDPNAIRRLLGLG